MKKFTALAALALALAATPPAFAQEMSFEPVAGNMFFPWTQTAPTATAFPADNYFFGGNLSWSGQVSEGVSYSVGYGLDPILRSSLYMIITYDTGFAKLSLGPIMGLFNSFDAPLTTGLSAKIHLDWPGVAFATVGGDSSIGANDAGPGMFSQTSGVLSGGFYFPNAILTLQMLVKQFTFQENATLTTTDSYTRYAAIVDIFQKNAPFNLYCTMGWQTVSKSWNDGTVATDTFGSVILGAKLSVGVANGIRIIGGIDTSVFSVGLDGLIGKSPSDSTFLFNATLGMAFDFDILSEAVLLDGGADDDFDVPIPAADTTIDPTLMP